MKNLNRYMLARLEHGTAGWGWELLCIHILQRLLPLTGVNLCSFPHFFNIKCFLLWYIALIIIIKQYAKFFCFLSGMWVTIVKQSPYMCAPFTATGSRVQTTDRPLKWNTLILWIIISAYLLYLISCLSFILSPFILIYAIRSSYVLFSFYHEDFAYDKAT